MGLFPLVFFKLGVYYSAHFYTKQGKAPWELQQAAAGEANSRQFQSARIEQFVTN
jgi:hypothetical protein